MVMNTRNGKVETSQVFDTYKSSEKFEAFIDKKIPAGFMVIAACKDDCTTNLSTKAKDWFADMGASGIYQCLKYRKAFAFVGFTGGFDRVGIKVHASQMYG